MSTIQLRLPLALLAITAVVLFGSNIAYAGPEVSISVSTDKPSYATGEPIVISGELNEQIEDSVITIKIFEPSFGRQIDLYQPLVGEDKKFTVKVNTEGIKWSSDGTYTVDVVYGSDIVTQTSFEFDSSYYSGSDTPSANPKNDDDDESKVINQKTEDKTNPINPNNDDIEKEPSIPEWVRDTAKWWSEGSVDDSSFTEGISFLIKENVIIIPDLPSPTGDGENEIPEWIKNTAGWWSDGAISDQEFSNAIKFLVENGIIQAKV